MWTYLVIVTCVFTKRILIQSCQVWNLQKYMNFIVSLTNSKMSGGGGDLTCIICTAVTKVTSGQAIGAQKMRGVWAILVRSNKAR